MLVALVDGRALPAGELAFIGNVAPQTASFHLRKLLDAALIAVEKQGKHSYYRLANEWVAASLEALAVLAPPKPIETRTPHDSEQVKELRFARTCYRHLAGLLAVEIHQSLLHRGFVAADTERTYLLTDAGEQWCRAWGMKLPASARGRKFPSRACIDWTERRHHLGGAIGTALLSRLIELRWIAANPGRRSVRVTHLGAGQLEQQFGIAISHRAGVLNVAALENTAAARTPVWPDA